MRVYRASSLGYSLCQLVCPHLGYEGAGAPEWLQNAYDKGHELEPIVLDTLRDHGWTIDREQEEVSLEVIPGEVVVVGHLDGIGGQGEEAAVVEVKTMAHKSFMDFKVHGWDSHSALIEKYKWQASAYMLATGLSHAMVTWDKDNRTIGVIWVEEPFYTIADIANKLAQAESYIVDGVIPDGCNDYPCSYYYLHEEKDAKEVVDADSELESILAAWHEADKRAKIYEGEKKVLREEIMRLVGSGDLAAPVIKSKSGVKVETYWQEGGPYSGVRQAKWVTKVSGPR
jgi:hypothetical protein